MEIKNNQQSSQDRKQPSSGDPVIDERIDEEKERIKREIKDAEENIREWEMQLPKPTLAQRVKRQDPGLEIKKHIEEWRSRIVSLQYSIERAADRVTGQINSNRISEHRYWIDYFFDHSVRVDIPSWTYPYDEISRSYSSHQRNHYSYPFSRTYENDDDALREIRHAFNDNKHLMLYDTTDPHLQMCHEPLIDLLVRLGFARNDELMRGIDAMRADTNINPDALEKYTGPLMRSACSLIQEPTLYRDNGGGVTSTLIIEGSQDFDPKRQAPKNKLKNAALSKLCKEWDVPDLQGSLTYRRTPKDTMITVQLSRSGDIIDGETSSKLPVPYR